ncbi:UPF0500 protein C1orf216 homolog [Microcaecilia unicolor]|uniref:UPF0500 protein C1orf216 homolog n=1 Tax=Microcaecilia unicolor TaxID=1415580 RepID=A0A6P7ZN62_9AMPH|nr:UPF0500 protein C1orf216 homolog [Microcaecilia unicolor]
METGRKKASDKGEAETDKGDSEEEIKGDRKKEARSCELRTDSRGTGEEKLRECWWATSAKSREMFAVLESDGPVNSLIHEMNRGSTFGGTKEYRQDKNFNIVEDVCGKNENWNQVQVGLRSEEKTHDLLCTAVPEDNLVLLAQRQKGKARLRDISQTMESEGIGLSCEDDVRSPPEGAEIRCSDPGEATADTGGGCDQWAGSPLEDNGYASSSLSIDSPDSTTGNLWDGPAATSEGEAMTEDPKQGDGESSSDSEALFPTLLEAFQNLKDKEKYKELEKEKHHVHLTMYRRLALLRWIRSLQQKVIDQQNRLQESFDTILDNRKELLRYIQQGVTCSKEPIHATEGSI